MLRDWPVQKTIFLWTCLIAVSHTDCGANKPQVSSMVIYHFLSPSYRAVFTRRETHARTSILFSSFIHFSAYIQLAFCGVSFDWSRLLAVCRSMSTICHHTNANFLFVHSKIHDCSFTRKNNSIIIIPAWYTINDLVFEWTTEVEYYVILSLALDLFAPPYLSQSATLN